MLYFGLHDSRQLCSPLDVCGNEVLYIWRMKYTNDRFELLETFIRIAESGSLSKAAPLIGTTQPTISRRLSDLERLLGCKLVIRSTSGLSLTDEGRVLLAEAYGLRNSWEDLSQRLSGSQSRPDGTLRVIGPPGYANGFITDVITGLRLQYPQLRIELTLTDHVEEFSSTGAECWICVGTVQDQGLAIRYLGKMQRILIAAPQLASTLGNLNISRLASAPFIGLIPHVMGEVRFVHNSGKTCMVTLDTPLKTNSLQANYRAVLNGAGIGSAAPWMCNADIQSGKLVQVLPQWSLEPMGIHIALPPGVFRPARVTALIAAVETHLHSLAGFIPVSESNFVPSQKAAPL